MPGDVKLILPGTENYRELVYDAAIVVEPSDIDALPDGAAVRIARAIEEGEALQIFLRELRFNYEITFNGVLAEAACGNDRSG